MNTVPTFPISKAEFYRFVVANEGQGRFEFVRRHIVKQMRGRTRRHGCVAMAICQSTWSQIDRDRWTCLPDCGVETSETIWQRGEDDTFPAEPTLFGANDTVTIAALSMTLGIAAIMADAR